MTGNGELGFYSGEGGWEMATRSKESSRRETYPMLFSSVECSEYSNGEASKATIVIPANLLRVLLQLKSS